MHGDTEQGFEHLHEAIRINPMSVETHYILGSFLMKQGEAEKALPEFKTAIAIRPHFESAEEGLASAYQALDNPAEALAHWRRAHVIDPSRASAVLGSAWLLATAPDASLRNGAAAVADAESARDLSAVNDPGVLDTLAAAYAEDGQFTRAVATAAQALELAVARGDKPLADQIRARLQLYKTRKAFHAALTRNAQAMATVPLKRETQ